MIYFTFFHSLFWQNTMNGGWGLPFLFFSGPKCSIMQKSYTTHAPKQKKLAQFTHIFHCHPPLLRRELGLKTEKEATGTPSPSVWPKAGHSPQPTMPALELPSWFVLRPDQTLVWQQSLWKALFLSIGACMNLVAGSHWQKGRKAFNFHKIRKAAELLLLFLLSAFSFTQLIQFKKRLFLSAIS